MKFLRKMMIRIKSPEEYIKYPRPWIFLGGSTTTSWRDEVISSIDGNGTFLDPMTEDYDAEKSTKWEMLALWSCDSIVMWFGKETLQPISLFEIGTHTARYFTSQGKTPYVVLGVDPEYQKRKEIEAQIDSLNTHLVGDCPQLSIVDTLEEVVIGVKEEITKIRGRVDNIPICDKCYKTIPCGEHVISFAQARAMKDDGVSPPKNLG